MKYRIAALTCSATALLVMAFAPGQAKSSADNAPKSTYATTSSVTESFAPGFKATPPCGYQGKC